MSKLRPECGNAGKDSPPALPDSVHRLQPHIFTDEAVLHSSLIDEVAAVNDSMEGAKPSERWKKVNEWLRWKVKVLAQGDQDG